LPEHEPVLVEELAGTAQTASINRASSGEMSVSRSRLSAKPATESRSSSSRSTLATPPIATLTSSASREACCGSASHSPNRRGTSAAPTRSLMISVVRKYCWTKPASPAPIWSFLFGMIAVCGIGMRSGCRNSAVTANQSASPPTMDASAAAWRYPHQPWPCPTARHTT
jgi:hypothetical protein